MDGRGGERDEGSRENREVRERNTYMYTTQSPNSYLRACVFTKMYMYVSWILQVQILLKAAQLKNG